MIQPGRRINVGQGEGKEEEDIGDDDEEESGNCDQKQKAYKRKHAPKTNDVNQTRMEITKQTANNTTRCAQSTDAISYYKQCPPSKRSNIRATQANAGLISANIICYSNVIFQCIASCAKLTDLLRNPPNEEHGHFELRSVISSMVSGGMGDIDPSKFIDLYNKCNEDFNANGDTWHDSCIKQ